MNDPVGKRVEAFQDLLIAGMMSAAIEMKQSQFRCVMTPEETGKKTLIRIIIVPEAMQYESPDPDGFQVP